MDRIDLILIHWPCAAKNLFLDTWRALIRLQGQGRVTDIGVSNFNAAQIDRLIGETGVTPVLNQIELHPLLQQTALRVGKSPAPVILRWHLEIGCSVIPRSTRAAGLAENLGLFDFALTTADHAAIANLDCGERIGPDPDHFA